MTHAATLVELSTSGTLLIYHTTDNPCLIPNPTEQKWARTITPSLFLFKHGPTTKKLVRSVELMIEYNYIWHVIKRGGFKA